MIEITAKQLYNIYSNLPNCDVWLNQHCLDDDPLLTVNISKPVMFDDNYEAILPIPKFEVLSLRVDKTIYPLEWKPTVELIIKP